jgi:hypothetical protein
MSTRTVVKFGTMVSVLLFCIAVGYYAFMKLDMANHHRDVNLFTLIQDDCTVVLRSDDISACLGELSDLNY